MSKSTITVQLPQLTYRKLQRAAELTHRSIDEILLSAVESSLPTLPDMPEALADELTAMHLFSDDALWAAVEPSFSPSEQVRLTQLNQAAGERSLTSAEIAEQETLLTAYHRSVLRRAQALAILSQRGHGVTLDELPIPQP